MKEPKWLTIARGDVGIKEVPGPGNNPKLMAAFARVAAVSGKWILNVMTGDAIAHCGAVMADWFIRAGIKDLPKNPLSALAWLAFGLPMSGPAPGCVGILTRPGFGTGHVFLYTGENATHVRGISGNVGDKICEAWFDKKRIKGWRCPSSSPMTPAPVILVGMGPVSKNEA